MNAQDYIPYLEERIKIWQQRINETYDIKLVSLHTTLGYFEKDEQLKRVCLYLMRYSEKILFADFIKTRQSTSHLQDEDNFEWRYDVTDSTMSKFYKNFVVQSHAIKDVCDYILCQNGTLQLQFNGFVG